MGRQTRSFLLAVGAAASFAAQGQTLPKLRVSDNRRFLVKQDGSPFFQQADWVINRAESLGLYMAPVPIWGGSYLAGKRCVVDKAQAHAYGTFLGRRYRDKPIVWMLSGDWFPDGVEEQWRVVAASINEGGGVSHLKTYHPTGLQTSAATFHNDAWLDFNMVQSRHIVANRTYELIAEDCARTPVKPVIEGESVYEGITSELLPYDLGGALIQAHDIRRAAYCGVFAGAAGIAYGSHGVWDYRGFGGKKVGTPRYGAPISFEQALRRPAGSQMQPLRTLIESRPMLVRVPDQWLIANDPLSTTGRIQACRASDRSYASISTSSGRPVRVRWRDKIHKKLSGTAVRVYWDDPRRGTSSLIGEFPTTGAGYTQAHVLCGDVARTFTPPSSGPGNDWVLVIDDATRNFPPLGKKGN